MHRLSTPSIPVQFGPFVDLPDTARVRLLRASSMRFVGAGQLVLRRGAEADRVVVIQSGLVAIELEGPDSRRLAVSVLGAEDVVGELTLAGVPRVAADVVALQDTVVLSIEATVLQQLRTESRDVDAVVLGVLADCVRQLSEQVVETTLVTQPVRLRRILLRLRRHSDDDRVRLTHAQLSDVLGCRRATVTSLLANEVEAGRLETGRGWVRVVDVAAMRLAAASSRTDGQSLVG